MRDEPPLWQSEAKEKGKHLRRLVVRHMTQRVLSGIWNRVRRALDTFSRNS